MGVTVGALYAKTNDFLVVYICVLFIKTGLQSLTRVPGMELL